MSHLEYLSPSIPVSMTDDWFEIADENHFWMQWRFNILLKYKKYLPIDGERILEIGCGNGIVMHQFENQLNYTVDGCDLNLKALNLARKGKGRLMLYNIYDKNPDLLKKYSAVLLMDVIEHIDDDVDFLKTATRYLKPGGIVVINVPALMSLFSNYDREAGHVRRYDKKMLSEVFEKAGISTLKMVYWGGSLLPVAMLRKLVLSFTPKDKIISRGFKPPGNLVNKSFKLLMNLETGLPFNPVLGTSLLAIGKIKC
jgi:SAM-dependent methyltransferase